MPHLHLPFPLLRVLSLSVSQPLPPHPLPLPTYIVTFLCFSKKKDFENKSNKTNQQKNPHKTRKSNIHLFLHYGKTVLLLSKGMLSAGDSLENEG